MHVCMPKAPPVVIAPPTNAAWFISEFLARHIGQSPDSQDPRYIGISKARVCLRAAEMNLTVVLFLGGLLLTEKQFVISLFRYLPPFLRYNGPVAERFRRYHFCLFNPFHEEVAQILLG